MARYYRGGTACMGQFTEFRNQWNPAGALRFWYDSVAHLNGTEFSIKRLMAAGGALQEGFDPGGSNADFLNVAITVPIWIDGIPNSRATLFALAGSPGDEVDPEDSSGLTLPDINIRLTSGGLLRLGDYNDNGISSTTSLATDTLYFVSVIRRWTRTSGATELSDAWVRLYDAVGTQIDAFSKVDLNGIHKYHDGFGFGDPGQS